DSLGASESASVTIDVGSDLVPSASASATPTSGSAPLETQFFANATGGDAPLSYKWTFGDGSAESTDQDPTHTYTTPGSYTATLLVSDSNGDTDTDTVAITVEEDNALAISASATPTSGIAPLEVQFGSSVSSGDAPFTYEWNFGDGS